MQKMHPILKQLSLKTLVQMDGLKDLMFSGLVTHKYESKAANHMTWHISGLTTQMCISVLCYKQILKPSILWHKILLLLMKFASLHTNTLQETQMLVPTNLDAFTSWKTVILTNYYKNVK
jgi:hypothetical protein